MKRTRWIVGVAGTLVALAGLAWAFAPRPIEVETATVATGRFQTAIDEDGKTRLRDRYVVSAALAGTLERITLREGDAVEAGAVVAKLRPVLPPMVDERTMREQQAAVELAEAQLLRAKARMQVVRSTAERVRREAARSAQLASQGFLSDAKAESDRLASAGAAEELEAAVHDVHASGHALEQAKVALIALRSSSRSFDVRAPTAGRVLRVLQASEATVALGAPLLELGDVGRMEVVAELLSSDALNARPGSPVLIERWGGSDALQGKVRSVEPAAFTKISALGVEEQRVKVLIDITSPPEQWRLLGDGYRVGVRIVTLSVDNVVKVPGSAVFPLPGEGGMAVFMLEGGRAHLKPVVVAARNGAEAWVKEGLTAGQVVIVYPPAALRDDARVKERKVF